MINNAWIACDNTIEKMHEDECFSFVLILIVISSVGQLLETAPNPCQVYQGSSKGS